MVNQELHADLSIIMKSNKEEISRLYPAGSFRRLFWDQQFKAASVKQSCGFWWHPMMIRWCLNLKILHSTGFITLPSERTLRDYSNYIKTKPGFQDEVNVQLKEEAQVDMLDQLQKAGCTNL